jgi:hypothetical protein
MRGFAITPKITELASGDRYFLWFAITLILIEPSLHTNHVRQMKLQMNKTLRFWVDVAIEHIKLEHRKLTRRQLVAQVLRKYEQRGDAMRCLDKQGKLIWKASPRFLDMLADAEHDARDDLADWP